MHSASTAVAYVFPQLNPVEYLDELSKVTSYIFKFSSFIHKTTIKASSEDREYRHIHFPRREVEAQLVLRCFTESRQLGANGGRKVGTRHLPLLPSTDPPQFDYAILQLSITNHHGQWNTRGLAVLQLVQ